MNIPSPKLYLLMLKYIDIVDSGILSEERTEAHNEMMTAMRLEFYDFATRDDARELAIEVIAAIKELFKVQVEGTSLPSEVSRETLSQN